MPAKLPRWRLATGSYSSASTRHRSPAQQTLKHRASLMSCPEHQAIDIPEAARQKTTPSPPSGHRGFRPYGTGGSGHPPEVAPNRLDGVANAPQRQEAYQRQQQQLASSVSPPKYCTKLWRFSLNPSRQTVSCTCVRRARQRSSGPGRANCSAPGSRGPPRPTPSPWRT